MSSKIEVDFQKKQVTKFGKENNECGDCSGSGKVLMLQGTTHDRVPSVQPDGLIITTKIVEIFKYEKCRYCGGSGERKKR